MRNIHRRAMRAVSDRGLATVIHSPDREFVFGDGFYHNFAAPSMPPALPRILAPLTPRLSVLYAIPQQYSLEEPRLTTLVVSAEEAAGLNQVVQVYAREMLFYRSEKPDLTDDYRAATHRHYTSSRNPVEEIVHELPGVPDRDASLDFLEDMMLQRDRS